jgi:hypothetical protein
VPSLPLPPLTPDVAGELATVLARFAVDAVALAAVMALLVLRRRGGRDLVVACTAFNVGLFGVVQVITGADIGVGAAFGLFAVLSIIRLRSELFTTTQLGYVFVVLALALVTGVPGLPLALGAALAVLVVGVLAVVDTARRGPTARTCVVLDVAVTGPAAAAEVERRLGLDVVSAEVVEVDLVRETTRLDVVHRPLSAAEAQQRASLEVEQL